MREQPPDRHRRVGPSRPHATGPCTGIVSFAGWDLNRSLWGPQGEIADTLAIDPSLSVRDRTLAACTRARLHLGLPISGADARKLRAVYRQRRLDLAALARLYR